MIICFTLSCGKNKTYENFSNATFNIKVKECDINNTKKLSEIVETVKYIPLETTKNCLIGKVSKIKYHKGKFYIYDKIARTVFLYNEEGTFLFKYSAIGKGPFEYIELNDMDIDSEGNCYLLDTRKIIKLDEKLNPLKEIKLPFGTLRFAIHNNEIALVHLGNENEIQILSNKGKELTSYIPYSGIERKAELKPFIKFESDLLYKPIHCDDIFSINSDSILLHTKIHFEKPVPQDYWIDKKSSTGINYSTYMSSIYYYCETEAFIFFRFMYNYKGDDGPFYTLYSKKDNSTIIYTNNIKNDCYMSEYPPLISEVTTDGRFIATIDASSFYEAIKSNPELSNSMDKFTVLSNPVIALIKFKEL